MGSESATSAAGRIRVAIVGVG
ncbi:MAG: hypothetical protein QOE89_4203, partial [Pseudonocardiales bacterium]|nr:hypothetical protein [Pseudonocardiales bacterium]